MDSALGSQAARRWAALERDLACLGFTLLCHAHLLQGVLKAPITVGYEAVHRGTQGSFETAGSGESVPSRLAAEV